MDAFASKAASLCGDNWASADFDDVFAAVMDTDPWEEHVVHELDLCLRWSLSAQALAAGLNHLSTRLEQQPLLLPDVRPARRRIRAKQTPPPAYDDSNNAHEPPPVPVVPRMRARYWMGKEYSNREGASFACPIAGCSRKYTTKSGLGHHLISHRGSTFRETGWDCPHCCRSFESESAMTNHIRLHDSNASPYICPECGAYFPDRDSVRMHMSSAHPLSHDMLPITCAYCLRDHGVEQVFMHLHSFRMHLLSEHIQCYVPACRSVLDQVFASASCLA